MKWWKQVMSLPIRTQVWMSSSDETLKFLGHIEDDGRTLSLPLPLPLFRPVDRTAVKLHRHCGSSVAMVMPAVMSAASS